MCPLCNGLACESSHRAGWLRFCLGMYYHSPMAFSHESLRGCGARRLYVGVLACSVHVPGSLAICAWFLCESASCSWGACSLPLVASVLYARDHSRRTSASSLMDISSYRGSTLSNEPPRSLLCSKGPHIEPSFTILSSCFDSVRAGPLRSAVRKQHASGFVRALSLNDAECCSTHGSRLNLTQRRRAPGLMLPSDAGG